MIIGERFNGDLLFVQDMQHDFYNRFIGTIFYKAKMKYLAALKVIDIDTQLGKDIKDKESMDHRPIQYMHDVIAARFRYIHRERLNQCSIQGVFSDWPDEVFFKDVWYRYYAHYIEQLYEQYPNMISIVLIATTYPNPNPLGIDAEDTIYQIMKPFLPHKKMIVEDWETKFMA